MIFTILFTEFTDFTIFTETTNFIAIILGYRSFTIVKAKKNLFTAVILWQFKPVNWKYK
jgi:hypothetical protein